MISTWHLNMQIKESGQPVTSLISLNSKQGKEFRKFEGVKCKESAFNKLSSLKEKEKEMIDRVFAVKKEFGDCKEIDDRKILINAQIEKRYLALESSPTFELWSEALDFIDSSGANAKRMEKIKNPFGFKFTALNCREPVAASKAKVELKTGWGVECVEKKSYLSDARLNPSINEINEGKNAYMIEDIKKGSVFDKKGLRNGDIIVSVSDFTPIVAILGKKVNLCGKSTEFKILRNKQ